MGSWEPAVQACDGAEGWGMAHECLCSGCSVLWPLTVTRAKLGGGDRITPFSGAAPQFLQPLREAGPWRGAGDRQDQAQLKGLWRDGVQDLHGQWTTAGVRRCPGLLQDRILLAPSRAGSSAMGSGAGAAGDGRAVASGVGTGREGRKGRKSRNGCMVSAGFPVPPQEPELHWVHTAPGLAPGGRQHQPHGRDLAAHAGWRGHAPLGGWQGQGPLCGSGKGSQPWFSVGSSAASGDVLPCTDTCPAQRPPAPTVPLPWGRTPWDHGWDQFGSQQPCWSPGCWDTSRLSTFLWGLAPQPPTAGSPGAQGDCASSRRGWSCWTTWGWCPCWVVVTSCAALGTSPVHGKGDTAGFDPKLPPPWHHPHGPQLPLGLGALGTLPPSQLL